MSINEAIAQLLEVEAKRGGNGAMTLLLLLLLL